MSEALAWMAGFFDGEGCVVILPRRAGGNHSAPQVRVAIGQKDRRPLEYIQSLYGGSIHPHSSIYNLALSTAQATRFLRAIRPFLRVKDKVVDVVLDFDNWRSNGRNPAPGSGCPYSSDDERIAQDFHNRVSALNRA